MSKDSWGIVKEKAEWLKDKAKWARDKLGSYSLYIIGLTTVLLIGLYVRTRNLKWLQGKYLLGLDPYCFYRYAGYILEHGRLMAHDAMRYVPIGYAPEATDRFFSYCLAYGYKLLAWTGLERMNFHILYPAVAGIIGFVFLYLFVRELFGDKVALVSTAFAAVIPALIYRTGAGFADHEALALVWMFASFWLFAKAWKADRLWKGLSFGVGSGLLAGFMALTWGGYRFLLAAVGIFVVLMLIFSKLKRERFYVFLSWFVVTVPFLYLRAGGISFIKWYEFMLLAFAALASLLYFAFDGLKVLDAVKKRVPIGFLSLVGASVIGLVGIISTGVISLSSLYARLMHPTGASRLALTVSENAQPYFFGGNGWYSSFGLTVFLMLAGSVLLFYNIFKGERKYSGWLTFGWVVAVMTFIFGRYKAGSSINTLFSNVYLYVLAAFVLLVAGVYLYTYYKDRKSFDKLFSADWELLLLFSWFIFSLVIARGAVRTIMALAPVAAVLVGYFVVTGATWLWSDEKKVYAVLLCLFAVFCFVSNANQSYKISLGSGSGYPGQWETSMNWIRENTPEDSVIAHWWDYGYWTQTMGERSTIGDGGNAMRWDHQLGRYGLLGRNASNYMSYYKTHEITHLLISEEEIGKFHAFSTVGSDESFDLSSTVGTFGLQQEKEVRNGSRMVYGGRWFIDKGDSVDNDYYTIGELVLRKGASWIDGFILDQTNGSIYSAQVVINDGSSQYFQPLKCVCKEGKCETINPDGFGGCFVLTPYYKGGKLAHPIGAGFFVSEKVEDTLLVKLYIKGEEVEGFTEVYNDSTPFGLHGGNIIGPIKIWEVEYPDWAEEDEKYLEKSPYG